MTSALDRTTIRGWIEAIRAQFRVEIPDVAKRSTVSASTIYRWLDDSYAFNPSMTSLRKIADAFGVPMPGGAERGPYAVASFNDGDLQHLENGPDDDLGPTEARWRVLSRALELAGFLPGDEAVIDTSVMPRSGDFVCAQVRDLESGAVKFRIRLYEPPFLTTRTMDPSASDRPLYVDNERVLIIGTVVRRIWIRPE